MVSPFWRSLYEYFCNDVPFYSVLPDGDRYSCYSEFDDLPIMPQDVDGEGARTPSMCRARIVEDLPELLHGARILINDELPHEEAARQHFTKLVSFFGGDASRIDSFDGIHNRYV